MYSSSNRTSIKNCTIHIMIVWHMGMVRNIHDYNVLAARREAYTRDTMETHGSIGMANIVITTDLLNQSAR